MIVEFSLKPLYSTMCGKNFEIHGIHIPRKCIDSKHFYSCPFLQLTPQTPGRRKLLIPPRQHSFENLFPPTAKKGGGNYDLLYQISVRKCEDVLEHKVFYIMYDLQFFQI